MKGLGSIVFSAAMVTSMSASASEIRVFSGGAPQEVFAALVPKFEQQSGHKVTFVYEVITALRERIARGETADVRVMPVGSLPRTEVGKAVRRLTWDDGPPPLPGLDDARR